MNKKFLIKCLVSIGFLLFFVFVLPEMTPSGVNIAQATTVEKEKAPDYKLNLRCITLVKGKSFTLKIYNTSEDAKIRFKSDDPEIASVSEDGTISANKVGFTIITATIKDDLNSPSLTCDVTVGPPAFSVKMTRFRIILGSDQTDTLSVISKPSSTAEIARFSSYDASIASVSAVGRITARRSGLTYLFAEIDALNIDGSRKFAICTVIIVSPEDVIPLETYFYDHPELNTILETELTAALEEFFNRPAVETVTTTPGVETDVEAETDVDTVTKSLVESLDQFLEERFGLAARRKAIEDAVVQALQTVTK